eukprot:9319672-Pyramimonas_sp.AAC.1
MPRGLRPGRAGRCAHHSSHHARSQPAYHNGPAHASRQVESGVGRHVDPQDSVVGLSFEPARNSASATEQVQ